MDQLNWQEVSVHEVICAFIQAEKYKRKFDKNELDLINNPKFDDINENKQRESLLLDTLGRKSHWDEIPDSTQWWHVGPIDLQLLKQFHVIDKCGWNYLFEPDSSLESVIKNLHDDLNIGERVYKIRDVLAGKPQIIQSSTILFGHHKEGPFTIIEGNKRWCALNLSLEKARILKDGIYLYIGISSDNCHWHFEDE